MIAEHSKYGLRSEIDIVFKFESRKGIKYALLIEDKICEKAQKNQPQRYREVGNKEKSKGTWNNFKTCIVAPKRYLDNNKETKQYDHQLSYQDIVDWFKNQKNERYDYKAKLLQNAIEHNKRGYTKQVDDATTNFYNQYYRYVSKKYPELNMKEPPEKSRAESWIHFYPDGWDRKLQLLNKLSYGHNDYGVTDLQFTGWSHKINKLKSILKKYLKGRELAQGGKSAMLRVRIPKVDTTSSFKSQLENIEKGIKEAQRLMKVGIYIKDRI